MIIYNIDRMSVNNRCKICTKKISLLDTVTCTCRCKEVFCPLHRLDHNCTFDYKKDYKDNNKLVKITADKIETLY